jgi:hypothetical protein
MDDSDVSKSEEQHERRRTYEAQCLKYQDGAHESLREFDRAILTLSAGLLGLSLAFIKDVVSLPDAIHLSLLFYSWALFGSAILLTLVSFIASQKAFRHAQTIAYDYYINEKYEVLEQRQWPMLVTRYLTYASGGCFVIALVLTLVFVISNVNNSGVRIKKAISDSGGHHMSDDLSRKITDVPLREGVEPSNLVKVPGPRPLVTPANQTPSVPASAPKQPGSK